VKARTCWTTQTTATSRTGLRARPSTLLSTSEYRRLDAAELHSPFCGAARADRTRRMGAAADNGRTWRLWSGCAALGTRTARGCSPYSRSILGSHSHRRSSQSDAAAPCCAVRCCAQQPRRAQRTTAAASLARLLPHTAQHKRSAIPFQRRWRAGLPLGGPQWPLYCPVVAAAHTTLWVLFPIDQPAAPRESDASRHGGRFRRVWHNFFR
jgi:hypothetical protein